MSIATPALTVLEEDRHAWFAGRTRAILAYLDRAVGVCRAGSARHGRCSRQRLVLDIGSGAGNMAHHLAHYGRVIGLDYHPRPLAVAEQRGLETCQGLADELPFPDSSFDLIALLDTVEHIADEFGVYRECLRVLKPGGHLVLTVPAFMWLWSYNDEINAHERRYSAPELQQKLEISGFRVAQISYNNFFLFPLIAGLRLLRDDKPELDSPHVNMDDDVYQVEMEPIPEPVNSMLHVAGWLESKLLKHVALPFGTSVICMAAKPEDAS